MHIAVGLAASIGISIREEIKYNMKKRRRKKGKERNGNSKMAVFHYIEPGEPRMRMRIGEGPHYCSNRGCKSASALVLVWCAKDRRLLFGCATVSPCNWASGGWGNKKLARYPTTNVVVVVMGAYQ